MQSRRDCWRLAVVGRVLTEALGGVEQRFAPWGRHPLSPCFEAKQRSRRKHLQGVLHDGQHLPFQPVPRNSDHVRAIQTCKTCLPLTPSFVLVLSVHRELVNQTASPPPTTQSQPRKPFGPRRLRFRSQVHSRPLPPAIRAKRILTGGKPSVFNSRTCRPLLDFQLDNAHRAIGSV